MDANHLTLIARITLFALVAIAVPASADQETTPLDTDDATANQYIESALSEHPDDEPKLDHEYYELLKELELVRAESQSNQTQVVEKKAASDQIPAVQSISNKSPEERAALYHRLADQTGISIDEIRTLFENQPPPQLESEDSPQPE